LSSPWVPCRILPDKIIILLFFLLLPLYIFPFIAPEVLKSSVAEAGILLFSSFLLIKSIINRSIYISTPWVLLFLILGVIYFSYSAWRGVNFFSRPEAWLPLFYMGLFVILFLFYPGESSLRKWVVYIAGLVAIFSLWERFLGLPGKWSHRFPEKIGILMGNPNRLGAYLGVVFPLSLRRDKKWEWIIPGAIFLSILLSRAEGVYLSLGFAYISWLFIRFPEKRKYIFLSLPFLLLLVFIVLTKLPLYSIQWRIFHWRVAWRMFLSRPLDGMGWGKFMEKYPLYQRSLRESFPYPPPVFMERYVHNDYLQILVETGIIGEVIFLSSLLWIFTKIFTQTERRDDGLAVSFLVYLFLSLVSFPLFIPSLVLPLLFLSVPFLPRRKRLLSLKLVPLGVSISVLFLYSLSIFPRILKGEFHYRKGIHFLRQKKIEKGRRELFLSKNHNPYNPFLYYSLAVVERERGDLRLSYRYIEKALKLGLQHPEVLKLKEELEKRIK